MIRVKITQHGGYVLGDGECPFNPDEFLALFGDKVLEAQRAGMEMLEIPDDVIEACLTSAKVKWHAEIAGAPVREFEDNVTTRRLLDA